MSDGTVRKSRRRVRQKPSHARLLDTTQRASPGRSRSSRLDAIVIPASRPASSLAPLIDLASSIDAVLVVLCSRQTDVGQVADRVSRVPGARGIVIDVRTIAGGLGIPNTTGAEQFRDASAGRTTDLSTKRNLGLLLARLHGWNKIAFFDDDITLSRPSDVGRIAEQLEHRQVSGMICRDFPDNSVVCHARRLAGLPQDNFVSGAVLGVNCGDHPLSFFPDIYNEDWFFFSRSAFHRTLSSAGHATQAPYEPYANPDRARHEEFGDVLAEGLYAQMGNADRAIRFEDVLRTATPSFWCEFIEARQDTLERTGKRLESFAFDDSRHDDAWNAVQSLTAARDQLAAITPDLCADFVEAWQDDVVAWQKICNGTNTVGGPRDAMDVIGATRHRVDAPPGPPDRGPSGGLTTRQDAVQMARLSWCSTRPVPSDRV
jgi:hypothetical protein